MAGVALAVVLTGGAAAGPLHDGNAAAQRGDYATALRLWRPLAEQGDAAAQYNLGNMYVKGAGVPQDDAEAVKWYRLAAEQDSSTSSKAVTRFSRRSVLESTPVGPS